jgi:effector protein SdbA
MPSSSKQMSSWLKAQNPLILASSGGNGHISAAQSLIQQFLENKKKLSSHYISVPEKKIHLTETLIWSALKLLNTPLIKKINKLPSQFKIPSPYQLQKEKIQLIKQQQKSNNRLYLDYLLDLLPNGYLYTAIFNLLQSQGQGCALNKVTKGQIILDTIYKYSISDKIYQLLIHAIEAGTPYDSIISTQALGIGALCHAVNHYNKDRLNLQLKYNMELPVLHIHQFITDIPEESAQHYLKPLKNIALAEKQFLSIHLLELEGQSVFQEKNLAHELYFYAPEKNPIIRPELRTPKNFHGLLGFNFIRIQKQSIKLWPKQKFAVLMLSSGQGQTTIDYLNHLIHQGIEHIAIVGKTNVKILKYLAEIKHQHATKIYNLGHLNAYQLRKILASAHLVIIKGGGLSLMEMASFSFRKNCKIFIHHTTSSLDEKHQAGLIWEEGNIRWFLNYCKNHHKKALLTYPDIFQSQLLE